MRHIFPDHIPMPDAEAVCVNYLLNKPSIQNLVEDRVSTELPRDIKYPFLTISLIGGIPIQALWLEQSHIQVSSWAETKRDAFKLASTARAALLDMGDGYRDDIEGAYVTGVEDLSGLLWMPDDSQTKPIPRYLFGISVYLHP
jgi:hypothetical protein